MFKLYYQIMYMKLSTKLLVLFIYFSTFFTFSQNLPIEEDLISIPKNYFELNRELFHLQLNKNSYLTNETIWFKGFIKNNISQRDFKETSNVYVTLLDGLGIKIISKLFYAKNGSFDGFFKLTDDFKSGIYYLQVFTNWSNNFTEDESSLFKIEIINTKTGKASYKSNEVFVNFYPESGVFLENTVNTIGISIVDCNNKGVKIVDGIILTDKNEELSSFQTNDLGLGRFQINNANNIQYKIKFNYKNKTVEKNMPLPSTTGTAFSINNFSNDEETYITFKTNKKTLEKNNNSNLYFSINQNDKLNYFKFKLDQVTKKFTLPDSIFYNGVNTIRIIDENNKQLNERLIFKKTDLEQDINFSIISQTKDSIKLAATFLDNVSIGLSVVPEESSSIDMEQSLLNSFLISPYLKTPILENTNFFGESSRKKSFELDLFLLCQEKGKYEWENMKNPPTEKYSFNQGVTLKGTINSPITGLDNKIQLFSLRYNLNQFTEIVNKNEFYFKNVIAIDSSNVNFTLVGKDGNYKELNYFPQVISNDKPFNKSFNKNLILTENFSDVSVELDSQYNLPKIKDAITLNDVLIKTTTKKPVSENKSKYGNFTMRNFKINDGSYKMYTNVIQFLNANGFNASSRFGSVSITSRMRNSFSRVSSPTVFLDDVQLYEFDLLDNLSLKDVDEIFIDKYGSSIESNGGGVIKIYSNTNYKSKPVKNKFKNFIIKNGFCEPKDFTIPQYDNYTDEGFKKMGTIFWSSTYDNQTNAIQFTIPILNQKSIKIFIEGVTEEGEFISKVKTILLE